MMPRVKFTAYMSCGRSTMRTWLATVPSARRAVSPLGWLKLTKGVAASTTARFHAEYTAPAGGALFRRRSVESTL
jgi:hypothetical protein